MKHKVLKINNLTFGYTKDTLIYDDFNLSLEKGEIKSIVGSSGSGKSTLFELIMGNLKPFDGEIVTKKTAVVFQDPYSSFHPTYSIIEQIKDIVDDMGEMDYLLDKLDLTYEHISQKPHNLSGGQLQRASILRALLLQPKLLLVDEPTSALDNVIALEVMQLLIKFKDRFGILLITHDDDLARWCSNEIINLEEIR